MNWIIWDDKEKKLVKWKNFPFQQIYVTLWFDKIFFFVRELKYANWKLWKNRENYLCVLESWLQLVEITVWKVDSSKSLNFLIRGTLKTVCRRHLHPGKTFVIYGFSFIQIRQEDLKSQYKFFFLIFFPFDLNISGFP